MNTTVVKFNTLTNPVGAATQDDNLFPLRGMGLILHLIS